MSIIQCAQSSQTFHEAFHGLYFAVASAMSSMYSLFNTLGTILYRSMSSLSSLPHIPALLSNSCTVVHLSMLVILGQSPCRSSQVLFLLPLSAMNLKVYFKGFKLEMSSPFQCSGTPTILMLSFPYFIYIPRFYNLVLQGLNFFGIFSCFASVLSALT